MHLYQSFRVLKHSHSIWSSEANFVEKKFCPRFSSENCQVVAGLGLLPESHLLVLASNNAAQESFGLLANALPPPAVGHAACILLLAVFPQPDLSDDPLKEGLNVVVEGGGRLDELAVEHHCTGTSLCNREDMETGC